MHYILLILLLLSFSKLKIQVNDMPEALKQNNQKNERKKAPDLHRASSRPSTLSRREESCISPQNLVDAEKNEVDFYRSDSSRLTIAVGSEVVWSSYIPNTDARYGFQSSSHVSANVILSVASDTPGRISDNIGDPPGQQIIYISPGDIRSESYRSSTFEHFLAPVDRRILARCGFYFTGFFDRVKCFACGRSVEGWITGDDPSDARWHKLTSFARWPLQRPNISPATLARSGFFYLGDLDRSQCFSCGGVLRDWNVEDDADEEHRTHFPGCYMMLRNEPRNIPAPETPEQPSTNFPCQYPANSHMRSLEHRVELLTNVGLLVKSLQRLHRSMNLGSSSWDRCEEPIPESTQSLPIASTVPIIFFGVFLVALLTVLIMTVIITIAFVRAYFHEENCEMKLVQPPNNHDKERKKGDIRSESYRLSTFEHFLVPVDRRNLARCGFYFTRLYDIVKCFACGRTVEGLDVVDNPSDARWHKSSCPMPKGIPCGNIPNMSYLFYSEARDVRQQERDAMQNQVCSAAGCSRDRDNRDRNTGNPILRHSTVTQQANPSRYIGNVPSRQWRMANVVSANHIRFLYNLFLNRELDRLTSFARWPVQRPNISPATLARSGFFYLGDLDRSQCFSCGAVFRYWLQEYDADEVHQTYSPSCHMVQGGESRNITIPKQPETPEQRATNFPCQYPANPHMRSLEHRVGTFDQRWPAGKITATPAQIAEAGFFFLGNRDRVRCWYCNGGLQNWERDDIPWEEHAKWFPNCQFLLQEQGQMFVYRHLVSNPHLARPIIARQAGSPLDLTPERLMLGDIPQRGSRVQYPNPPTTIMNPQEFMTKKEERIKREIEDSEAVQMVLLMGYADQVVRQVLEEKIDNVANQEDIYDEVTPLLEDVMNEAELREEEEGPMISLGAVSNRLTANQSRSEPSLEKEDSESLKRTRAQKEEDIASKTSFPVVIVRSSAWRSNQRSRPTNSG